MSHRKNRNRNDHEKADEDKDEPGGQKKQQKKQQVKVNKPKKPEPKFVVIGQKGSENDQEKKLNENDPSFWDHAKNVIAGIFCFCFGNWGRNVCSRIYKTSKWSKITDKCT